MLIERTITMLQAQSDCHKRAEELGTLGYMQWLAGLAMHASYPHEVSRALSMAEPFKDTDPAIAAFCALLRASSQGPLAKLDLKIPERKRRGGARARRKLM